MGKINRREMLGVTVAGISIGLETCAPRDRSKQETRKFTEQELREYIKNKRVVLFGGTHNPERTRDSDLFIRLIPKLKQEGFTHIALELDSKSQQQAVDQYLENGDETTITKQVGRFVDGSKTLSILRAIRVAEKPYFKVICYDDRQPKHYRGSEQENRQQWWDERERHGFDTIEAALFDQAVKIAIYTNEAHIPNSEVSAFQFGNEKNGDPILIRLHKPLGYRLMQKYQKSGVGIVDLTGKAPTEVR
jgi:hypothetical protein